MILMLSHFNVVTTLSAVGLHSCKLDPSSFNDLHLWKSIPLLVIFGVKMIIDDNHKSE